MLDVERNLFSFLAPFNCDFDTDFCGWNQDNNTDNFDWKRYRGPTTSPTTGPAVDHTTRSKYFLIFLIYDAQYLILITFKQSNIESEAGF